MVTAASWPGARPVTTPARVIGQIYRVQSLRNEARRGLMSFGQTQYGIVVGECQMA